MKRSDLKSKNGKNRLARRCLALLMALSTVAILALPGYDTLPTVSAANEDTIVPLEEPTGKLLASFDFEGDGANRLIDNENGVVATLIDGEGNSIIVSGSDNLENFFVKEGNNTYLDLSGDVYLSLTNEDGSGVLAGMAEVIVEMSVRTVDTNTNWAFFAAPNGNTINRASDVGTEHYLGILLEDKVTVERYANYGGRPGNNPTFNGWTPNEWYKIRVVFAEKDTTLYIDGDPVAQNSDNDKPLADCLRDNGVLWFGHASWGTGEGFNGHIDDIQIWGTPYNDITEDVENKQIIIKDVVDPANTVVNMFDYWTFGDQTGRDYGWEGEEPVAQLIEQLINNGINKNHLFLFDGSASIGPAGDNEAFGIWNKYGDKEGGTTFKQTQSKWGIVKNKLEGGYPQLALDTWNEPDSDSFNGTLKNLWDDKNEYKRTESLAYLFDPQKDNAGKASYPDVTGLFQIDDEGYYYFRSQEVFAELNKEQEYDSDWPKKSLGDANHITLYKTPWMEVDANGSRGQFFPFNDWTDLFYEFNGNLVQRGDQTYQANHQPMNHWFGMTIQTKFMQPTGGKLNPDTPMTFEFSGDDDVWIFIDDVLVADVGGVHNRIRVTIDYATGKIQYLGSLASDGIKPSREEAPEYFGYLGKGTETTLRAMFEEALGEEESNKLRWSEDNPTFADGTMHTLKFFYLERGNAASNCNIRFNLQEPVVDRIRKVDQNGDPLAGAKFELYNATINDGEFKKGDLITTTTSDDSGYASLTTANGEALDLSQNTYYILEETETPAGYRKNPPIVLQYHGNTNTLTVVNKYETGAYASFLADWASNGEVCYAKFADGEFSKSEESNNALSADALKNGLAIVVPVVKSRDVSAGDPIWRPMYGSNTYGWNTVIPGNDSEDNLIKALAEAAIMQIVDSITQDWYLRWDGTQLKGYMENLPGDATRYVFNGGSDADGDLVTLFLSGDTLKNLGLSDPDTYEDDDERYKALGEALREALEGKNAERLAADLSSDLRILYTENFIKNNRTVIYVPNEQRELRVRKVDEKGDPMEGAVFALFDTPEHAAAGNATTSDGVKAYGTTGKNGELIFRASGLTVSEADYGYGYAKMIWDSDSTNNATAVYWLKEITAPKGYALNESLIRVEVGNAGIYANATGFGFDSKGKLLMGDDPANDGISVEASLGRLYQTMIKYAEGIVDETLKYITITKQTANSSADVAEDALDAAKDDEADSIELVYKANGYAPVIEDAPLIFRAYAGYIRVMPRQTEETEIPAPPTAKRDILIGEDGNPIDLDGLFSLINTVIVMDMPIDQTPPSTSSTETSNSSASSENPEPLLARDNVPRTDDNSHLELKFVMLMLSLVGMSMGFYFLRRKVSLHEEEKHLK